MHIARAFRSGDLVSIFSKSANYSPTFARYAYLSSDFEPIRTIACKATGSTLPNHTGHFNYLILQNPQHTLKSFSHASHDTQKVFSDSETLPQKFVNSFPPGLQPYLRLSRVDRPIGSWLLFWPCSWGLTLGFGGLPDIYMLALFGTGALMMRGAGCTVNDMWDRKIDAKVSRTQTRPLVSGELRMKHATGWLAAQLSVSLAILLQLNPPCFTLGVGYLGFVFVYPLAKRITNWPQAVLGFTFNSGVLIGFTAAQNGNLGYLSMPWMDPSCLALYFAGVFWTLLYDTIYAHQLLARLLILRILTIGTQDASDDALLGLGSTALTFGEESKIWLTGFGASIMSLLSFVGLKEELGIPYFIGLSAVGAHLAWQIKTLNIEDPTNCAERFRLNRQVGWAIFLTFLASYWWKSLSFPAGQIKISQDPKEAVSQSEI